MVVLHPLDSGRYVFLLHFASKIQLHIETKTFVNLLSALMTMVFMINGSFYKETKDKCFTQSF